MPTAKALVRLRMRSLIRAFTVRLDNLCIQQNIWVMWILYGCAKMASMCVLCLCSEHFFIWRDGPRQSIKALTCMRTLRQDLERSPQLCFPIRIFHFSLYLTCNLENGSFWHMRLVNKPTQPAMAGLDLRYPHQGPFSTTRNNYVICTV